MPGQPLAVTGSTGALGGLVARGLAARGVPQRLLVRTPARAPAIDGAVVLPCRYVDRGGAVAALEGVETLLMVSASESVDRLDQHRSFVDAAAEAGVRHVVYTSFAGAAADCTSTFGRDHWATEEHIRTSGMMLRRTPSPGPRPMSPGAAGMRPNGSTTPGCRRTPRSRLARSRPSQTTYGG
jgi:NAD(P)H dehydrogenase (quinone)